MTNLGLIGKRVQSVEVGYTLVLQLSDVHFIAISSPLSVEVDGQSVRLSPEEDPQDSFGLIRELVGRTVEAADADTTGALDVTFSGGGHLRVEPDPAYEAWNVSGPNGALVVSMPGGELAIWTAQPRPEV
jgi:hypothetical protein